VGWACAGGDDAMSPMRYRRGSVTRTLGVALIMQMACAVAALAVVYPTNPGMYYQTNGRNDPPSIGDWYTTTASGSTDPLHRIVVEITAPQLAACGGICTITIQDAESTAGPGPLDEISGASDPTRFRLLAADGVTVLQTQIVAGGSPNGTNVTFTVNAVGWYQITSETGPFLISEIPGTGRNNDDNGFRIDVPFAGGLTGGFVGDRQTTLERGGAGTGTLTLYFLVGPAAGTTTLQLRNFDQDGGTGVAYTRPAGGTVAGTMSGDGVWNNGGTLNTGADTVVANTTIGTGAADAGVWTYTYTGWGANSQTIFEVLVPARLNTFHAAPLRAGSFTMAAPTTLSTSIGTPVDHAFSVTNTFFTTDIINLTTTGTSAGWTATILTSTGGALVDTDGNGQPDTGILAAGATVDLILRVTPNAGAIGGDVTTINGVSFMDNRVNAANNTVVTLAKTTVIGVVALTVVKSRTTTSDPVNGTTNPKSIPGAFVTYSVTVTNTALSAIDANTIVVLDAIPANTVLFVGDIGGAGSGPVLFVNGVPVSGLNYTFTSLASVTDDVSFSDDGGVSFVYTPVPNGNGVDPAVTHIRINPKGAMPGNGGGNPSFQVSFRVRVE